MKVKAFPDIFFLVVQLGIVFQNFFGCNAYSFHGFEIPETEQPKPRTCQTSDDCYFSNSIIEDLVYLTCEGGTCQGQSRVSIGTDNRPDWSLTVTDSSQCLISESGPCGTDRGLELSCQPGYECLEGRCRDPVKGVRRIPEGGLCHESIECQVGLECRVLKHFSSYTESYCVQNSTVVGEAS